MSDFDDPELDHAELTRPISVEERTQSSVAPYLAAVIALVVVGGGAILLLRHKGARIEPKTPEVGATAPAAQAPPPAPTVPAAASLPPLDASDGVVRELALALSRHPRLATWLAADDLVRRFVSATINVAEGSSPSTQLRFATPTGAFQARRSRAGWIADPESFRRYDLAANVFTSLDPAAATVLFRRLHPLFDTAYAELGDPNSSFDVTLARATGRLLAVPISDPPISLVPQGANFAFADHGLEERSTAEKHLLRMGPENARRVQAKLTELCAAIGIEPR